MILFLLLVALTVSAQDLPRQGVQAMREGRFADAEGIFRQLINQSPDDPRLRMNLGLALHSAHKYQQAIVEFDTFLKAIPQPGPGHLLAGTARLKLDKWCEAVPLLEKARQWQASSQVLVELGDAYNGCKRFSDAGKTYRDAAKADPKDNRLPRAAARAFWEAREYVAAQPLYASLQPAFGDDPKFLYEFGDTLARVSGAEAGLPYLERAVRAEPNLIPARGALGRALLELDRAADSVPHLEAAVGADPSLLLPLSRAYKKTGRPQDAARVEREYRRALSDQN
jgi:tetratricopeptide (TPR) repeat protein